MIAFTEPISKANAPKQPPLTKLERQIRAVLLAALDKIQSSTKVSEIRDALDAGNVTAAVEAVRIDLGEDFLRSAIPSILRDQYELAADTVATDIGYSFDILSPRAVDWVRANAASMIEQWGASSRIALSELIASNFQQNTPVAALARMIRDTGIGLTSRQARAVDNLRQSLAESGVKQATIDKRAERYARQLAKFRAELIARTETARASIHARQEAWRQGIASGLIDTTRSQQKWVATSDHRCCFPAGTMVETPDGQRPIESIRVGDVVLTHMGPREVSGTMSRSVTEPLVAIRLEDRTIRATADHPFVVLRDGIALWCQAESIRETDLLCQTQGAPDDRDVGFHVTLADADNAPALSFEPPSFPGVPRLIAVPVVSVSFENQPFAANQEVYGVAANQRLLNERHAEPIQFGSDDQFQTRGALMAPIAGNRAEPTHDGHAWGSPELGTAYQTGDLVRRPATDLGAVATCGLLASEAFSASVAIPIEGVLPSASLRADRVAISDRVQDSELLAARGTDFPYPPRRMGREIAGASAVFGAERTSERFTAMRADEVRMDARVQVVAGRRAVPSVPAQDWLRTSDAVSWFHSSIIVYDLTAGVHTFFADGVLVHNCDDCSDLNGVVTELGGQFVAASGADGGDGPPAHPACRCALVLVDRK